MAEAIFYFLIKINKNPPAALILSVLSCLLCRSPCHSSSPRSFFISLSISKEWITLGCHLPWPRIHFCGSSVSNCHLWQEPSYTITTWMDLDSELFRFLSSSLHMLRRFWPASRERWQRRGIWRVSPSKGRRAEINTGLIDSSWPQSYKRSANIKSCSWAHKQRWVHSTEVSISAKESNMHRQDSASRVWWGEDEVSLCACLLGTAGLQWHWTWADNLFTVCSGELINKCWVISARSNYPCRWQGECVSTPLHPRPCPEGSEPVRREPPTHTHTLRDTHRCTSTRMWSVDPAVNNEIMRRFDSFLMEWK